MGSNLEKKLALGTYRVLDLSEGGCMIGARMLADLGADVIKIEPPDGSPSRIAPFYKDIPDPEKSLYWFAYNLNKRGITLDLSTVNGQDIFKELVGTADVVMESFQPGYLDSLGLGYADLTKVNPDIIMTSITPFGQSGPKAQYRGSDLTAWASGGYLYICGNSDRAPVWISFPQALLFGGAEAAVGTLTALWHRGETGEGQQVDVSLQECAMSPTMNILPMWDVTKTEFHRLGGALFSPTAKIYITIYYQCKDGYVMIFLQGGNEPFVSSMERLVQWMGEEGMADDWLKKLDFVVDFDARTVTQATVDRVVAAIREFTLTKTKAELYEEGAMRRRILLAPLSNAKDISEDIQLQFRKYWTNMEHPELKESLNYCGPFVKMSETSIVYQRRAPLVGEHNDIVCGGKPNHSKQKAVRLTDEAIISRTSGVKNAFAGVKVAEFAWQLVGPLTSKYLADHGATVIKVESHNRPDTLRVVSPYAGNVSGVDNSMFYGRQSGNKYGVSIDLNHPNGRKLAWKLIMWADVVTESFSPGTMERWGLDYESLRKVRPDIIYLSTTMQGKEGPRSSYTGFGQNALSLSGFSEVSGWPDRMPSPPYGPYTDYLCPRFSAVALLAALDYRRRTGTGQWIEQSQFESALHFFAPPLMDYVVNDRVATRHGNRLANASPHGVFPCRGDDCWVAMAVFTDEDWRNFCSAVNRPEWINKDEFVSLTNRKKNEDELEKLVAEWTTKHTAAEVEKILQSAGVAAHIVSKPSEVYADEQLIHRRYFTRLGHVVMGEQAFEPQACFLLSRTPRAINMPSPCLGEHNAYVFKELLGMTGDEIADHIVDGSITTELPEGIKPMI